MTALEVPVRPDPAHLLGVPALAELARLPYWILWRAEERNGKLNKVPERAVGGGNADVTRKATQTTSATALGAYDPAKHGGLGFCFHKESRLAGVDLDGCRDPDTGIIADWARQEIKAADTYTEVSPSGTGVKLFGRGSVPEGRKVGAIEVYDTGRFFTVTGHHVPGTPDTLNDISAYLADLWPRLEALRAKRGNGAAGEPILVDLGDDGAPVDIKDKLEKLLSDPKSNFARSWRHDRPRFKDQSLSSYDLSLCTSAAFKGWSDPELAALIAAHRAEHGDTSGKAARKDYLVRTIAAARAGVVRMAEERKAAALRDTIQVKPGELHNLVSAAAVVLGRATLADPFTGYYRRGNLLCRPVRLADSSELNRGGIRRAAGTLVIAAGEPDAVRCTLTAAVGWERYDKRSEEWLPTDAPTPVVKALLATAPDRRDIPVLTGITEAPTLRPDGTVLDRPGYDPATGLLFDPGAAEFPPVPEAPTRDDALAALAKLKEIIAAFPFVDDASHGVALSGLITPLVRRACRAVPLHAFTAPKMGSGKTLLATLASYIANGRAPALMSQADDPNEEKKRIFSVLLEGQTIAVVDNVERELKSDALCVVLTEPMFSDRLLGVSKTVSVPSSATWYATGNNLQIAGDLTARAIACALDPECERPEQREFAVNLHEVVPARRAELAVAALTIVRAYIAAGMPKQHIPNFARFEDWSRFVRSPLVWLGEADPCAGRERVEGRDPVRVQLGALLTAWHGVFAGDAVTVATAIDEATREPTRDESGRGITETAESIEARAALREALTEVAGQRGVISGRAVGRFLSRHERRIEGGLRCENAGAAMGGLVKWRVRDATKSGFGGFSGFADAPNARMAEESPSDSCYKSAETNPPYPPNPPTNDPPVGDRVEEWEF